MSIESSLRESTDIGKTPDWQQFRQQMPVARKWAYFDHAAVAPIPQIAQQRINQWASEAAFEGDVVWPQWNQLHEGARKVSAQLMNAQPEEIALVPNTTFGINLVASGFPWHPGDNVVLPEHEFPSNVYPWQALESQGVEVRQVPLDGAKVVTERIAGAIDERTRIVSVSWVGYASGYRIDPVEISHAVHEQGALFFLDAIQGLGVFPLDVQAANIDFLAADGHKWMLGPEGAGVFYLKREHLDLLKPMNVGWNSVQQGNDFSNVDLKVRHEARRYEGGTQNMAGFIGLGASLELLAQYGLTSQNSRVGERVIDVSDQLCQALSDIDVIIHSPRGPGISSGIVLFEVPGQNPQSMRLKLLDDGVVTSFRGGHLRAAVHCYNDANDIDRLIESLKKHA